jgi:hypothetical protein
VAEGAKLTEAQGEEYGSRIAALMKESGINPQIGAELAGSLLEYSRGPQDVEKLMQKLSRTFNVLEKGRMPLARALPQISQIMGHGIESEEAAKLFSIASPAAPGQEGTAVESALKAIEEMKVEGKEKEFGVNNKMTQYDSIKAFAENINQRKQAMIAAGKTTKEAEVEIAKVLKESGVAGDVRERRGLVRGFGKLGVELGGFQRFEAIEQATPQNFEQARKERYEDSFQGKQNAEDIREEVARLERGEKYQQLRLEMSRARAQVTASGEPEKPTALNAARGAFSGANNVELEQQLVNRQALENVVRRATEAGIETPYNPETALGRASIAAESLAGQVQVNERLQHLLEEINRKTPEPKEAEKARPDPGKPLVAPPAGGGGARQ